MVLGTRESCGLVRDDSAGDRVLGCLCLDQSSEWSSFGVVLANRRLAAFVCLLAARAVSGCIVRRVESALVSRRARPAWLHLSPGRILSDLRALQPHARHADRNFPVPARLPAGHNR